MKYIKILQASMTFYTFRNHYHLDYDCNKGYYAEEKHILCIPDDVYEDVKQNGRFANFGLYIDPQNEKNQNRIVTINYRKESAQINPGDIRMSSIRFADATFEEKFVCKALLNQ